MKDGGAAFPFATGWSTSDDGGVSGKATLVRELNHGMSLRDYFAAAALPGELSRHDPHAGLSFAAIAGDCYAIADAMLAERDKP